MNTPGQAAPPAIKKLAVQLVHYFFPRKKIRLKELGGGLTNHVFAVEAGRQQYVVRISDDQSRLNYFLKEQWAVSNAKAKKIPVADILEVGNTVIPLPYMITEKVEGSIATGHPMRKEILFELGRIAAIIHTIPTKGYGEHFAWSENELSVNRSWKHFLDKDLDLNRRMDILSKNKMLTERSSRQLAENVRKIFQWKSKSVLQHGDLRLKNIIVSPKGIIKAVIDWEDCLSAIGPAWDLSIALHDLPVDGQQRFLEGYGISARKLIGLKDYMATFNLLNYAPVIETLKKERNLQAMAFYRARLHGAMDIFSLG
jgi:hygromycin-B 4-O-kinase